MADVERYVMPRPTDIVRWQHAAGSEFNPAIVTQKGRSAISVMVFPSESRFPIPKGGVLHVTDPRAKTLVAVGDGLWDYTEEHLAFLGVMDRVSGMLVKMQEMSDQSQWLSANSVKALSLEARLSELQTHLESAIASQSESLDAYLNQVLNGFKDGIKSRLLELEARIAALAESTALEERIKQLEEAFLNR